MSNLQWEECSVKGVKLRAKAASVTCDLVRGEPCEVIASKELAHKVPYRYLTIKSLRTGRIYEELPFSIVQQRWMLA